MKFPLTYDPMEVIFSKGYSPYSYDSFLTKNVLNVFMTVLTKVAYWNFEISYFICFKKIEIFVNMRSCGSKRFMILFQVKVF